MVLRLGLFSILGGLVILFFGKVGECLVFRSFGSKLFYDLCIFVL